MKKYINIIKKSKIFKKKSIILKCLYFLNVSKIKKKSKNSKKSKYFLNF